MRPVILFFILAISCGFFLSCTGANTQLGIDRSSIQYVKPETSTKLVKGEKVDYELWVDNNKWEIYDSKDAVFKDFRNMLGSQGTGLSHVLRHSSGQSMAIIQEIHTAADFKSLHKALSESLSMGKGSIISEDIRRVNGSDILYIQWMENLGTSKIVWLSYYLSKKTGHMRLAGGTTEDLLSEYEPDIIDLLNGLVDTHSKMHPKINAAEDIETKLSKLNNLQN